MIHVDDAEEFYNAWISVNKNQIYYVHCTLIELCVDN